MGKAVTRHLTYAWVEYGDPRDGQSFTDGLYRMGWKNAVSGFPVKKDAFGVRYVDAGHPLLPIRWRGSALLVLPNEKIDKHSHDGTPNPPLNDPLFVAFRNANGETRFTEEIQKQNKFIANWVFCPGIKRVSSSESSLTIDADITDHVDMVAISGHGAVGSVWGGGAQAPLAEALFFPRTPASDRLKYVFIASCFNVARFNVEAWLPAMRRDRPIHGVFGFGQTYPGDEVGEAIFKKFMANLKAGGGSASTILKAWRNAHIGPFSKIWAAVLHTSSAKNDTMAKWLAGKLEAPDKDGEVRWYDESNFPDGIVVTPEPPPFSVNFFMGSTKITAQNTSDPKVGLFPGQKGALGIEKRAGAFKPDEVFVITFFYYRPDKPGMNLNALLTFDKPTDGDLTVLTDHNKADTTTFTDAIQFAVKKPGLSSTKLPFTVNPDALKNYPVDGEVHGNFNLQLVLTVEVLDPFLFAGNALRFYREGAWLRGT